MGSFEITLSRQEDQDRPLLVVLPQIQLGYKLVEQPEEQFVSSRFPGTPAVRKRTRNTSGAPILTDNRRLLDA